MEQLSDKIARLQSIRNRIASLLNDVHTLEEEKTKLEKQRVRLQNRLQKTDKSIISRGKQRREFYDIKSEQNRQERLRIQEDQRIQEDKRREAAQAKTETRKRIAARNKTAIKKARSVIQPKLDRIKITDIINRIRRLRPNYNPENRTYDDLLSVLEYELYIKRQFQLELRSLNGAAVTYKYNINSQEITNKNVQEVEDKIIRIREASNHPLKVFLTLRVVFADNNNNENIQNIRSVVEIIIDTEIEDVRESVEIMFDDLIDKIDRFGETQYAMRLNSIISLMIGASEYIPLVGSSYIDLPKWIKDKKACINVKNEDEYCFLWAIASCLYPKDRDGERTSSYIKKADKDKGITIQSMFKIDGLQFPMSRDCIRKFESMNNIRIFLFGHDDRVIAPLYLSKYKPNETTKTVDLLLHEEGDKSHYCYIKNMSRLLSSQKSKNTKHQYYCSNCRVISRDSIDSIRKHESLCSSDQYSVLETPSEGSKISFDKFENEYKVSMIVYSDFECILPKNSHKIENRSTIKTHKHIVCGFAFKVVFASDFVRKDVGMYDNIVLYRGKDAIKKFIDKMVDMSRIYREEKYIPIVFHNLKGYDSHFIFKTIKTQFKRISVIPTTKEKYLGFMLNNLRFIDSVQFLNSSLDNLVENLSKGIVTNEDYASRFKHMNSMFKDDILRLLVKKGVYPYEYMDSFDKFSQTDILPKSAFYSSLTNSDITDEQYNRYITVWNTFKNLNIYCDNTEIPITLGRYHDLYLATDVLLLADVFESFRDISYREYGFDPAHYYTLPGFSWDCLLKHSKVKLELFSDLDMYLFEEKHKRGGISIITHRYAKANNKYMEDYDMSKPSTYLIDLDANNLYGGAMVSYLPVSDHVFTDEFDNMSMQEVTNKILSMTDTQPIGYNFMVDLHYPSHLHDAHNDYPLCPESIQLSKKHSSPFADNILHETDTKSTKTRKLVPNLQDKQKYVIHYRALKQALSLGLVLTKIHRVLKYKQEPWMKSYIEKNTQLRTKATNEFEKSFYKLMNNSVFGKTMENVRNHIDYRMCYDENQHRKLVAKINYDGTTQYNEVLVGVSLKKTKIKLNKAIYVGAAILDISKVIMYDFHYNVMKPKYGDKLQLLGSDTDSLKYAVECDDLYKDIYEMKQHFDLSDYPKNHKYHDSTNKKVLCKMKDEGESKPMVEFIGLRAKMYMQQYQDNSKVVAKGVKSYVKNTLKMEEYKQALFNKKNIYKLQNSLRSYEHEMYSITLNKSSLCAYDDKRYICSDGISTLAWGHCKIFKENIADIIYFNNIRQPECYDFREAKIEVYRKWIIGNYMT